jgi:hypothetical protein
VATIRTVIDETEAVFIEVEIETPVTRRAAIISIARNADQ